MQRRRHWITGRHVRALCGPGGLSGAGELGLLRSHCTHVLLRCWSNDCGNRLGARQRNLLSPLANGGTWTNLRAKSVPGFAGRQSLRSAMQCRIAWLVRWSVRDIGIVAVVARADVGSETAVQMHLARLDGPRWLFCILHRPLYHSRPTRNACVRWSVEAAFGIRAVAGHEECGKRRQVGRWIGMREAWRRGPCDAPIRIAVDWPKSTARHSVGMPRPRVRRKGGRCSSDGTYRYRQSGHVEDERWERSRRCDGWMGPGDEARRGEGGKECRRPLGGCLVRIGTWFIVRAALRVCSLGTPCEKSLLNGRR